MTTPHERSRSFIAGLELLQDLLDRKKTPRVPAELRERARRVLRHYPTASEMLLAVETVDDPKLRMGMPVFDKAELERYLNDKYPRPTTLQPLPAKSSES